MLVISPISPLYLPYISPISRQELTISAPMLNATIWAPGPLTSYPSLSPSPSPSPNHNLALPLTRSAPANKFYAKEKQLKFAHLNVDLNWAIHLTPQPPLPLALTLTQP